jgi:hypothetical protein
MASLCEVPLLFPAINLLVFVRPVVVPVIERGRIHAGRAAFGTGDQLAPPSVESRHVKDVRRRRRRQTARSSRAHHGGGLIRERREAVGGWRQCGAVRHALPLIVAHDDAVNP